MRTKTLAVMAAVGALIASQAMADVYSANTVGFVNVVLPGDGWHQIANPLSNTNNNLSSILPVVPDGTQVIRWDVNTQQYNPVPALFGGAGAPGDIVWDPDYVIEPGEGFMINVQGVAPGTYTLTFVGDVMQNPVGGPPLTVEIKGNWNMVASKVPQEGQMIPSELGYTIQPGDQAILWDPALQGYNPVPFLGDEIGQIWDPPLSLKIGQAVMLNRDPGLPPANWTRDFQVQ